MNSGSLVVTGGCHGIGKAILEGMSNKFIPERTFNIDIKNPEYTVDVRNYTQVLAVMEKAIRPETNNYLLSGVGVVFFLDPKTQEPVDFINAPVEQLRAMVEINLIGQINVLHAFIGTVLEKRAKGNIVVVSSISAFHSGGPNMAVYDATKSAISALAKRLVPYQPNIRINTIEPGSVRTNIGGWTPNLNVSQEGLRIVKEGQDGDAIRLGKEVSLSQVVNLTKFLFFSDHGLNGARIVVDEGLTLMGRDGY